MRYRIRLLPIFTTICLGIGACSFLLGAISATAAPSLPDSTVVQVDKYTISQKEFARYLASRPPGRTEIPETAIRKRLDDLVIREILYQQALVEQLDHYPAVREKLQQLLIQALLEKEVYDPVRKRRFSESELKNYYERHLSDYYRPDQRRIADIFFALPLGSDNQLQRKKESLAKDILNQIRENPHNRFLFSHLVQQYSDQPKGYVRGDTGYFDRKGMPGRIDSALVKAAFAIKKSGQIYDQVVICADGLHIIMLVAVKDGFKRKYSEVKKEIGHSLRKLERKQKLKTYIEKIKTQANITINNRAVAKEVEKFQKNVNSGRASAREELPPALPGR